MIPEFLNEFKDQLEKYKLETIKINAVPLADHESLQIHNSKFLGKPYVPKSMEYPKDKQNNPMILWAQINFAETSVFEDYPDHGILDSICSLTVRNTGTSMKLLIKSKRNSLIKS